MLIGENVSPTEHPLILSAHERYLGWAETADYIEKFQQAVKDNDVDASRALLLESVADFSPQCEVADLVMEERRLEQQSRKSNVVKIPGLGD